MATKTRNPTGDLSFTGTWTGTAGSRWQNVDDFPDSGNPIADGLTHGTTAGVGLFTFAAFDVPAGATIISLAIQYFDFKNASQSCAIGANIRCNDTTDRAAATHNPGNGNANIAQRTDTYATNPKTGVAWTVNDINGVGTNALTAFGWKSTDASPSITLSSIQAVVTYTIASTLTAVGGVFAETGTAASFRAARSIAAASGSFVETGADAALTFQSGSAGNTLAAASGSFTESGTAVLFNLRRRLGASSGSLIESGTAAVLRKALRRAALSGNFIETGIAAGFAYIPAGGGAPVERQDIDPGLWSSTAKHSGRGCRK